MDKLDQLTLENTKGVVYNLKNVTKSTTPIDIEVTKLLIHYIKNVADNETNIVEVDEQSWELLCNRFKCRQTTTYDSMRICYEYKMLVKIQQTFVLHSNKIMDEKSTDKYMLCDFFDKVNRKPNHIK